MLGKAETECLGREVVKSPMKDERSDRRRKDKKVLKGIKGRIYKRFLERKDECHEQVEHVRCFCVISCFL